VHLGPRRICTLTNTCHARQHTDRSARPGEHGCAAKGTPKTDAAAVSHRRRLLGPVPSPIRNPHKGKSMKRFSINALALAIGLAFSVGTMAQMQPKEAPSDSKTTMKEGPADVSKDAATEKRDADYKLAKEKCDTFAGDAKASCLTEANTRFGKS
jgi:hypothetical protein